MYLFRFPAPAYVSNLAYWLDDVIGAAIIIGVAVFLVWGA